MKYVTPVDAVDGCLMAVGLTVSLQDIQSILSIIIIIIDILWILGKFVIKLFRYLDDGKISKDEADDLFDTIDDLNNIKKKEGDK